jgi:hypothetical protein
LNVERWCATKKWKSLATKVQGGRGESTREKKSKKEFVFSPNNALRNISLSDKGIIVFFLPKKDKGVAPHQIGVAQILATTPSIPCFLTKKGMGPKLI